MFRLIISLFFSSQHYIVNKYDVFNMKLNSEDILEEENFYTVTIFVKNVFLKKHNELMLVDLKNGRLQKLYRKSLIVGSFYNSENNTLILLKKVNLLPYENRYSPTNLEYDCKTNLFTNLSLEKSESAFQCHQNSKILIVHTIFKARILYLENNNIVS